jgi:hypothetical protein
MTNTVLPTFQTQYILDFSSASRRGTLGFAEHFFQYKDVASVLYIYRYHNRDEAALKYAKKKASSNV